MEVEKTGVSVAKKIRYEHDDFDEEYELELHQTGSLDDDFNQNDWEEDDDENVQAKVENVTNDLGEKTEGGFYRTSGEFDITKSKLGGEEQERRSMKRPFEGHHMANYEKETDPGVISRRSKQIEYGKSTPEYYNYATAVPRTARLPGHPRTPNKLRKYSRRAWDGMVKQWRINLHCWSDFPISAQEQLAGECEGKLNESFTSEASGSTSTTSSVAAAFSAELGFLNSTLEKNRSGRSTSISESENELNCSSADDQAEGLNSTILEREHKNLGQLKKSEGDNILSTSWADEVEDYLESNDNDVA